MSAIPTLRQSACRRLPTRPRTTQPRLRTLTPTTTARFASSSSGGGSPGLGRAKAALYAAALAATGYVGYLYATDTRASLLHRHVIPPLLRTLFPDAEDAHHAGSRILQFLYEANLHPRERRPRNDEPSKLATDVFGATIDNPVGISAGLDKDGELTDFLFGLGAGVVEIGGITPLAQAGNERPRCFRVAGLDGLVNRYGLNSQGADAVAHRLRKRVRRFARDIGATEEQVLNGEAHVPPGSLVDGRLLAVQIAKNKETNEKDQAAVAADYVYCVNRLARYADIVVVNVSSPNTPGLRDLQATEPLTRLLTAVVEAAHKTDRKTRPKVMVKVSPDEDDDAQMAGVVEAVHRSGVDGVIVGNTTKRRAGIVPEGTRLSARDHRALAETGGYSGPAMFSRTLDLVGRYRKMMDAYALEGHATADKGDARKTLFATGGITNGEQALQVLNAGASVAMVYTNMVYGGAGTITRIKGEMAKKCDQCRRSKTRCDKKVPCSSCKSAKRTCTTTGTDNPGLQRKQRIHISSLYEQKIDRIEASLGSIERLLKRRESQHSPSRAANDGAGSDSVASPNASATISDSSAINTPANIDSAEPEPDQGLNVQTDITVALLKQAVRSTTLYGVDSKMGAALGSLYDLLGKRHLSSPGGGAGAGAGAGGAAGAAGSGGSLAEPFPMQKPVPPGGVGKLEMPPLQVALTALERLTYNPPTLITMLCASVGLDDIAAVFRREYAHLDNISSVKFVLVNSIMYHIFEEMSMLGISPELLVEYKAHAELCKANVDTGLANLPLLLSSTAQNVQGLLLGAFVSIDQSRPAVAWQLCTTAAQLCIAAGFQSVSASTHKPPEAVSLERILFWNVYILDKALCLRLNRGSCIPEYDIDIPREFGFHYPAMADTNRMTKFWVRASIAQGRIYEHLYSPQGRAAAPGTRVAHAKALAAECRRLLQEAETHQEQYPENQDAPILTEIFRVGEEIQLSVNLTLVYQAVSALDGQEVFKNECVEAARRAMRTHKRSMHLMRMGPYARSSYINWTILHTPFAPFFVILRHVLETLSIDDLVLLQEFIESLSHALDVSNRLKRFHQLCHVMCEVAGLFVGVKLKLNNSSLTVPEMPQALDNVNDLLHQQFSIGMPPPPPPPPPAGQEQTSKDHYQQSVPAVKQVPDTSFQPLGGVLSLPEGETAPVMGGETTQVVGGEAALPSDWDLAAMGTMDWTAGYENIMNLMQDELQILENYPNAGLF
ncbi:dihydroorotate reductase PyrE [Cordyceps javanica]|uniref:Dihydroorotate dehydrogenase (quinone), mitochondrial n=1 Tax=Cordyceps javanica TaxID=43265 RepID=A0A545UPP5_9HYPO|nr:dihydroorotate reductase PyrE [Cordyceps javanica]